MSAISQYQNDIRRYEKLKEQIISVITSMSLVVDSASKLVNEIDSRYQLNGVNAPIADRTEDVKAKIEKDINLLEGSVLPAINGCISVVSRKLASLEELERRKAEQARKEKK